MKFGYAYWGFLADRKYQDGVEISAPDGNAAYSWSILWEAQERGWDTWLLQRDRDKEYLNGRGINSFLSFSPTKRFDAWRRSQKTLTTGDIEICELDCLPDLDVVLIEWRWPIPGRNCEINIADEGYQPDLDRQTQLLEHFKKKKTKIILWDLDHKLTLSDEVLWNPDAIFETSVTPRDLGHKRTRVEPPIIIDDIMQFPTRLQSPRRKLVYVGSRYERDDIIDEWIKPVSEKYPFEVEFWGNWTREPNLSECRLKWSNILYNKRITMVDFWSVYSTATACPILAKNSYLKTGFITPRPWEALMFGTIPIGISSHKDINCYVEFVADDPEHLCSIVDWLSSLRLEERDKLRKLNTEKIRFMDVSNFVNRIEEIV